MNTRTPDSHYPWTKKWGAGHPLQGVVVHLADPVAVVVPRPFADRWHTVAWPRPISGRWS